MKKPADLVQLIEDLKGEVHDSSVGGDKRSKAVVHIDPDDEVGISLNFEECKLLLHSEDTVKQMHDAFGEPEEASVSLHALDLNQEVLDALERNFVSVDEL
jgi:hypothetical protein